MTSYTNTPRVASRADHPSSANFARQVTIDAFGWHHAKALDQGDFVDHLPGELPRSAQGSRSQ